GPIETTTTSASPPPSFARKASSTACESKSESASSPLRSSRFELSSSRRPTAASGTALTQTAVFTGGTLCRDAGPEERDDVAGRSTGREDLRDAELLELGDVGSRDRPAYDHQHLAGAALAQQLDDPWHERHVRAGEDRDPDGVGILLDRGLDDLLRRLVEPGVDHLHAGVAQRPRDHLGATVVPVETDLRDHDARLARHQKTGVSRQTPHTSRSASHISPMVTSALAASTIGGSRLRSGLEASSFRRTSADSAARASRRARSSRTRSTCVRSNAGSILRMCGSASASETKRFTPTITRSPASTSCW